jgi:hypothetical protein
MHHGSGTDVEKDIRKKVQGSRKSQTAEGMKKKERREKDD